MAYVPKRGDLVWTDFEPSAAHEQTHKRPAIILSPARKGVRFIVRRAQLRRRGS